MLSTKAGLRSWVREDFHRHTCALRLRRTRPRPSESLSTDAATVTAISEKDDEHPQKPNEVEGWFFVDSVFPIRLATWDFRYYIALFQEEALIERLRSLFAGVNIHGFKVNKIDPRIKDGGVFVNFKYTPMPIPSAESADGAILNPHATNPALVEIEEILLNNIASKGGLPSWLGLTHGNLWMVRGRPWREDMRWYASPILRVAFNGPDVSNERIWDILRSYGRIRDIKPPNPVPTGILRSTTVTFERTVSAAIAHNCVHGAYVHSSVEHPETLTRLTTAYERPIRSHLIRDWLASHPRIVLPVVAFLLGTLTYTVFDPIRAIAVQAKVLDWFDYQEFAVTKWLRRNALDKLTMGHTSREHPEDITDTTIWKDRREAESSLKNYLTDYPSTIMFVHGPAGSGKSRLVRRVLEKSDRRAMIIDCNKIYTGVSDTAMVTSLAAQSGYRPIFTFLNSVNNLIDLASMGLIGQKAGLSSSLDAQVSQILDVVSQGLRRVSSSRRREAEHRMKQAQNEERRAILEAERQEHIRQGVWHDGRIDFVAGNIMSELGMGIERFGVNDEDSKRVGNGHDTMFAIPELNEKVRREREYGNAQNVGLLPVVVIKNFTSKSRKEQISNALADWAASLVSNQIAHVIVVSDNRENAKRLAKALPAKPLGVVALADADPASSLSYIAQKLEESALKYNINAEEKHLIERLGGRASDLETVIHKMRAGQSVAEAVEDIIQRGVMELRKNAFGDDSEDAKGLPWTRQQAWTVLKLLAQKNELQYHHILTEFPFKGDENALRAMEQAEIISITTVNGRPSTIRPGKPIHRYVFQRLLADSVFKATQDIAYNELLVSGTESVIRSAETELGTLKDIVSGPWDKSTFANRVNSRARYLTNKMNDSLKKIERLEKENGELKKVLAQGDAEERMMAPQKRSNWWPW